MPLDPSVPAGSVREFIALAKAHPGSITFASSRSGGAMHLSGELFKLLAGMVHVPYKGGGPAVADLVSGHVSAMFDSMITAVPNINTGKIRPLGITTQKRSTALLELPTIAEAGLPGYDASVWWATT